MRMAFVGRAIGRIGAAVGADHPLWMGENALEVVLAHREANHADIAFASLQERDDEGIRLELLSLCETPDTFAVGGGVGVVAHAADLDVIPAADQLDFGNGLAADLVRRRGIVETLQELLRASIAAPDGEKIGQPGLIGDVGIAIEGDVDARRIGFRRSSTARRRDWKSTRLNSSHMSISYAVFCL